MADRRQISLLILKGVISFSAYAKFSDKNSISYPLIHTPRYFTYVPNE